MVHRPWRIAGGLGAVGLAALFALRGEPRTTPVASEAAQAALSSAPQATELPTPQLAAPAHYFPPLGLSIDPELRLDVDPEGRATVFESELGQAGPGIRRAHTLGHDRPGVFGLGWRAAFEARVVPLGQDAVAVERIQGATTFVRIAQRGLDTHLYASAWGAIEILRSTPAGYELRAHSGRTLQFDPQGRLIEVRPGYRIERSKSRWTLRGEEGAVELHLDARGRITRASCGERQVTYRYHAGRLVGLDGVKTRRYQRSPRGMSVLREPGAAALILARTPEGRIQTAQCGSWLQSYTFKPGGAERSRSAPSVRLDSPRGSWTYSATPTGWRVRTPAGTEHVRLDGRGRPERRRTPRLVTPPPGVGQPLATIEVDRLERLTSLRWPGGNLGLERDRAGRIVARRDRSGRVTFERDRLGNLTRVVTSGGRVWNQSWSGSHLRAWDGPMGKTTFQTDRGGRVIERLDATGRRTRIRYDDAGRPTRISASGQRFRYAFDDAGRLTQAMSKAGRFQTTYDAEGRPLRHRDHAAGVALSFRREANQRTLTTPWGEFIHHGPPAQPAHLTSPAGRFAFTYDRGRLVSIRYPNGALSAAQFDARGRPVLERTESAQGRRVVTHGYSEAGRAWTQDGDTRTAYRYDSGGRLTQVSSGPGARRTFAWDPDGHPTQSQRAGQASRWVVDRRGRLLRRGPERFAHDAAGRVTARWHAGGVDRFGYDGSGRLSHVQRAGGPRVDYAYDALGRVATRTEADRVRRFVYAGTRCVAELVNGSLARLYAHGPGLDQPLAYRDQGGRWIYLHANQRGDVERYTDPSGRVVDRAHLSPFGELTQAPSDPQRPVLFAGRPYDRTAGLVWMRARVYDPSLRRFLTPDPSGLDGGVNAYAYADNDPLGRRDPLGLWSVPDWADVGDAWEATRGWSARAVIGAREGLAHLTGFGAYLWEDVKRGGAQSRILGAVDGMAQFVTLGLVDPRTRRWAYDLDEAELGRPYGRLSGAGIAIASGAGALRAVGPHVMRYLPGPVQLALRLPGQGWQRYLAAYDKNPLRMQMITQAVLTTGGDGLAQYVDDVEGWDWKRTLFRGGFATLVSTPLGRGWLLALNRMLPSRTGLAAGTKTALNEVVFQPAHAALNFTLFDAMQGRSAEEIKTRLAEDLPKVFALNSTVWPGFNFLKFKYVPVERQQLITTGFGALYQGAYSFFFFDTLQPAPESEATAVPPTQEGQAEPRRSGLKQVLEREGAR